MADPRYNDSNSDAGEKTPATPRWVTIFAIIASVVVSLFVILHLAGGGPVGH